MVILEGILALHDQRILDMLDMKVSFAQKYMQMTYSSTLWLTICKIFCDEDADVCLSRRSMNDLALPNLGILCIHRVLV